MKVLANDGISASGKEKLEKAGYTVITSKVAQEDIASFINKENCSCILVRSATTVRKSLIDACPGLKFIGRGGVGMDNIDVEYARSKGIVVENTPAASSQSVAELVMAHMFGMARFMHQSNRQMPSDGHQNFNGLKKAYSSGIELRGKTLGIIGFGRIGQSLASYALGIGMKVMACDAYLKNATIEITLNESIQNIDVKCYTIDDVLKNADIISLHVPKQKDGAPVISGQEIDQMKPGVMLINAARGGVIDEDALIEALASGKITHAALDVFDNEPNPSRLILDQKNLSLSPHIGAATNEAQDRIGTELADKIIETLGR